MVRVFFFFFFGGGGVQNKDWRSITGPHSASATNLLVLSAVSPPFRRRFLSQRANGWGPYIRTLLMLERGCMVVAYKSTAAAESSVWTHWWLAAGIQFSGLVVTTAMRP